MTTYPHGLTKCEKCGSHYCMGCVGEECPNCKLQEVAFYAIELEKKLEAVKTACEDFYLCKKYETGKTVVDAIWKILEAETE